MIIVLDKIAKYIYICFNDNWEEIIKSKLIAWRCNDNVIDKIIKELRLRLEWCESVQVYFNKRKYIRENRN